MASVEPRELQPVFEQVRQQDADLLPVCRWLAAGQPLAELVLAQGNPALAERLALEAEEVLLIEGAVNLAGLADALLARWSTDTADLKRERLG